MINICVANWTEYKALVIDTKLLLIQYEETPERYEIYASEDQFMWQISLLKDAGADVVDFEDNYKASANHLLIQRASIQNVDGSPINVSTEEKQDTGNTTLASIDNKLTNTIRYSDSIVSGTDEVIFDVENYGTLSIHVGTNKSIGAPLDDIVYFDASLDGTNYFPLSGKDKTTTETNDAQATIASIVLFPIAGLSKFKISAASPPPIGTTDFSIVLDKKTAVLDGFFGTLTAGLPANAATESTLADIATDIDGINTKLPVLGTDEEGKLLVGFGGFDQPISATTLPLPTGAATEAKQDTGNTNLSSIDAKITAVNTGAVVISSSALPSGASTETTVNDIKTSVQVMDDWDESDRAKVNIMVGQVGVQGASGAVSANTQRVVLATDVALPAGTNAIGKLSANSGVDIGDVDVTSLPSIPAGNNNIGDVDIASGTLTTVSTVTSLTQMNGQAISMNTGVRDAGTQRVTIATNDSVPVSIATAPVLVAGTALIGKVGIDQTTPGTTNAISIAQLGANTVATGNGTSSTGVQRVALISDPTANTVAYNVNTNSLGRTELRFYAVAAAAGTTTTETAITLTKSSDNGATSTGTSFVITNGKKFRITSFSVATRGHSTATIQTTTFNLRLNTAGAVITSSTPIILAQRSATPATASAWDRTAVICADGGLEITGDGTLQFGITAAATYTTNAPTWDVTITGYEY